MNKNVIQKIMMAGMLFGFGAQLSAMSYWQRWQSLFGKNEANKQYTVNDKFLAAKKAQKVVSYVGGTIGAVYGCSILAGVKIDNPTVMDKIECVTLPAATGLAGAFLAHLIYKPSVTAREHKLKQAEFLENRQKIAYDAGRNLARIYGHPSFYTR